MKFGTKAIWHYPPHLRRVATHLRLGLILATFYLEDRTRPTYLLVDGHLSDEYYDDVIKWKIYHTV